MECMLLSCFENLSNAPPKQIYSRVVLSGWSGVQEDTAEHEGGRHTFQTETGKQLRTHFTEPKGQATSVSSAPSVTVTEERRPRPKSQRHAGPGRARNLLLWLSRLFLDLRKSDFDAFQSTFYFCNS